MPAPIELPPLDDEHREALAATLAHVLVAGALRAQDAISDESVHRGGHQNLAVASSAT